MPRHEVARVGEVPPGGRKRVTVGGRDIVLFNVGGEFFALADRCPHQGGRLSEGLLVGLVEAPEPGRYAWSRPGEIVRCPWHGWEFDLRTGRPAASRPGCAPAPTTWRGNRGPRPRRDIPGDGRGAPRRRGGTGRAARHCEPQAKQSRRAVTARPAWIATALRASR